MSILTDWLRKSSTKVILKAAADILKAIIGEAGKEVWGVAQAEVFYIHSHQEMTGPEKFQHVTETIKAKFPGIAENLVRLTAELAYTHLKESLLKK